MRVAICISLVTSLVVIGCSQKPHNPPSVLARVGEKTITVEDLRAKLAIHARSPLMAARYALPEHRRSLLEEMIRDEALVQEAQRRGYDNDPVVLREMVQRMFQEEIDQKIQNEEITEREIETYFHEHSADYSRPDRVHVAQIVVKEKAKAIQVAKEAKRLNPNDLDGFKQLVLKYSEDPTTREQGGDLGSLERGSKNAPQEIVEAAFALPQIGAISDPVQVEDGFVILQLQQYQHGFKTTAEALGVLKPSIQKRIVNERRLRKRSQLVEEVLKKTKIEIMEKQLTTADFK